MQHLIAYFEDVDQANTSLPLVGVPDQAVTVDGNNIRVPIELPFIAGGGMTTAATTVTSAQIQAPSLRDVFYPNIKPMSIAAQFGNPPQLNFFPNNPIGVEGLEDIQFVTNTDNVGNVPIYGLVWLQDGPMPPVTGEIRSIRATAAVSLSAGNWVNGNLTFDQVLPVGDYQVVGLRVEGTGLIAARIVFQGYPWRPGVQGRTAISHVDVPEMRFGGSGVWGTFNNNVPPTIDCLGIVGTSQAVILDLIKTS